MAAKKPAAARKTAETRVRYRDRDYQDQRVAARMRERLGLEATQPEYDEVEVVTLVNPEGEEVRVTKDQVEAYTKVWGEGSDE